jgi:MOSC domain-containing protein YiiM
VLDLSFRFDRWFDNLPASPRDVGRVHACVLRTGEGQRELPDSVEIVSGKGLAGDHWGCYEYDEAQNEVSLINVHVVQSLAHGDPRKAALSGDNFQVDLDLSIENLPVGTVLTLGDAQLRISEIEHRPCVKFVERFGARAAKRVARANRRGLRGRGVLCEVVRDGMVRVDDEIRVEKRPQAVVATAAQ